MKKLTHIAAPVAFVTALLSACAGPEQMMQEASLYLDLKQALDNPGPGGLQPATVQQALDKNPAPGTNLYLDVQQALENPGPGGLQQAVQQALDENPAPGNLSEAVQHLTQGASQEAVNAAVQQALAQQLASQTTGKEDTLYQELAFEFSNLVLEEPGRKEFLADLDKFFDCHKPGRKSGDLCKDIKPGDDRQVHRTPRGKGDVTRRDSGVTFTLRDPWGIKDPEKGATEDYIASAAERARVVLSGSETKGVPVTRKSTLKPVSFSNAKLEYRSAVADSEITVVPERCSMVFRVTVAAEPLEGQSDIEVWVYDADAEPAPTGAVKATQGVITPELAGIVSNPDTNECEILPGRKWFVMAYTTDDPVVAEYHTVRVDKDETGTKPGRVQFKSERIEGKVTDEKPACPPEDWGEGAKAALEAELPSPEGETKCVPL